MPVAEFLTWPNNTWTEIIWLKSMEHRYEKILKFLQAMPTYFRQECIPVGCIPPTAVAVCWGGVSASVHAGIHTPRCGPGDPTSQTPQPPPWVWAWWPPWPDPSTSPWFWAWRPPSARPINFPPGCGPGDPTLARPINLPLGVGLETCKACSNTIPPQACKACWNTTNLSVDRMTDTCKNITFANFVCGR